MPLRFDVHSIAAKFLKLVREIVERLRSQMMQPLGAELRWIIDRGLFEVDPLEFRRAAGAVSRIHDIRRLQIAMEIWRSSRLVLSLGRGCQVWSAVISSSKVSPFFGVIGSGKRSSSSTQP